MRACSQASWPADDHSLYTQFCYCCAIFSSSCAKEKTSGVENVFSCGAQCSFEAFHFHFSINHREKYTDSPLRKSTGLKGGDPQEVAMVTPLICILPTRLLLAVLLSSGIYSPFRIFVQLNKPTKRASKPSPISLV